MSRVFELAQHGISLTETSGVRIKFVRLARVKRNKLLALVQEKSPVDRRRTILGYGEQVEWDCPSHLPFSTNTVHGAAGIRTRWSRCLSDPQGLSPGIYLA